MKTLVSAAAIAVALLSTQAHADVGTAPCTMTDLNGNDVSWVWARFGNVLYETFYSKNVSVTMSPNYAQPTWTGYAVRGQIRIVYDNDPRFWIVISRSNAGARLVKDGQVRAMGTCSFRSLDY